MNSRHKPNLIKSISAMLTMMAGIVLFVLPVYARTAADRDVRIEGVPYDENTFEIQLDGKVVPFTKVDNGVYQIDVDENSEFITVIQYYRRDSVGADPQPEAIYDGTRHKDLETEYPDDLKPFPKNMAVWKIGKIYEEEENDEGGHDLKEIVEVADRIPGFDNILSYVGFALKQPSNINQLNDGGLRVTLSMPQDVKQNGVRDSEDRQIYSIKEYGLLHIFSRNWNSTSRDRMTVNDSLVERIASYRTGSGGIDYLDARTTDTTAVFSNYLYNINDYNVNKYFRGYIVVREEQTGHEMYLYGPIVGRNPYYVALNYKSQLEANPNKYNNIMTAFVNKIVGDVSALSSADICNIIFIGDSIMMGQTLKAGATGNNKPADYTQVGTPPSVLMGNAIAKRFGPEKANVYATTRCTLIANGGTTYSQPGVNGINMPDLAQLATQQGYAANEVNFVFLWAGVNDWAYTKQGQVKDGNNDTAIFGDNDGGLVTNGSDPRQDPPYSDSDKTYAIGFDRTLKKVTQSFPNAKIIVCSPLRASWPPSGHGTTTRNAATGRLLSEYSYLQMVVSNYYRTTLNKQVYFINLYDKILGSDGGMGLPDTAGSVPEATNAFTVYFPDRIHPNQEGYKKVCQTILNIMQDPNKLGLPAGSRGLIPDKDGHYIEN